MGGWRRQHMGELPLRGAARWGEWRRQHMGELPLRGAE